MSGVMIELLNASAETPGMPPCVAFENELISEGTGRADGDFGPTDSSETEPRQVDLSGVAEIGGEHAEGSKAAAGRTVISANRTAAESDPDLWLYRDRTVGLLRRYMRLSIEVGRLPSLLGREFFRSRVTSYGASTFEDSVIFVHDVERSLEELNEFEKKLIAKIVLQQYSKEEAGRLLGCGYRTVERLFPEALDRISEILLRREILTGLPKTKGEAPKSCQGGKSGPFLATD